MGEVVQRGWDDEGAEEIRERWMYRMWDLSQFMKSLKQRFTQWFNKKEGRSGTLWEDTFRSVVVEDGYALRVMAAYIDLNPVRAGIVRKPEEYRWCSYAEALAGRKNAREGIERVMAKYEDFFGEKGVARTNAVSANWRKVIAAYRVILFTDGEEIREDGASQALRKGMSSAEVTRVKEREGLIGRSEMLRDRLRHFSEGMAIGSRGFLEEVFEATRVVWSGAEFWGEEDSGVCDGVVCTKGFEVRWPVSRVRQPNRIQTDSDTLDARP